MRSRLALSLTFGLGLLAAFPAEAGGCYSLFRQNPTEADFRSDASEAVDRATAIIDAEVVRAAGYNQAAVVRAVQVLKGPQQELFLIGYAGTGCEIEVGPVGTRRRLLLSGGPDIWYFEWTSTVPEYEDELLGSDRQRDWPFRLGSGE